MKPAHCTYLGLKEPCYSDEHARVTAVSGGRRVYCQFTRDQRDNLALRRACLEEFNAFIVLVSMSCKKCGRIEQTPESSTCDGCGAPK